MNLLKENILIALNAIRVNTLRTVLTVLIIGIGITALVGILTSTSAIEKKLESDFSMLGSNTFTISRYAMSFTRGNRRKPNPKIADYHAENFKDLYDFEALVSLNAVMTGAATVKTKKVKTDPNVRLIAGDENYISSTGYAISEGRGISKADVEQSSNVVIVGQDVVTKLFKNESPINQEVKIGNQKATIIGVLESKGSSMGFSGDNQCIVPLSFGNKFGKITNYAINISVFNTEDLDAAIDVAEGLFRIVRKDRPGEENSFGITRSNSLSNFVIDQLSAVQVIATIIGIITLFGAAIGLMNIMLVSVTERTKEIGTRKALGASSSTIRNQFLIESVVISQLGGLLGILLGIVIGNLVSSIVGGSFIVPWNWMILGAALCSLVGIISGYYPARQASALNPTEALRYE